MSFELSETIVQLKTRHSKLLKTRHRTRRYYLRLLHCRA